MSIPYATTTVSILRPSVTDRDGYPNTEPTYPVVSHGIRAVVASGIRGVRGGGAATREGSVQEIDVFKLVADPCDLRHTDRVLDEGTKTVYRVEWLAPRTGLGLDHMSAGLSYVQGFQP